MSKIHVKVNEPQNEAGENPTPEAVEVVTSEIDQLREERDKYLDLLRRTQADFDNYQKRAAREAVTERRFAQRALGLEVLPALDNMERFLSTVKEENDLTKAIHMVHKQLLDGLSRQGIKRMVCIDQPFDPNLHQAILEQPSDKAPGTILIEAEAGYQYHDRVLRPAKVIVAKKAD